jgi:4-amino-4-deoxy-L-arabinose transferase-like glycosyltransferase
MGSTPPTVAESAIGQRDLWLLALAATGVLGVGLWQSTGITGLDEHWYGFRTVLETRDHGEWWIPTLDGEARVRKPPLVYWLAGLSITLFGDGFLAVRLPTLAMGVALVLSIRALSRALWGGSGLLAAWLALATFLIATESRRAMLDLPVALAVCLAVLAVIRAHREQSPAWLYAAALAAVAGTLVKGPVVLPFLAAAAVAAAVTPALRAQALRSRHWLGPILAFVALAGVWPISVMLSVPDVAEVLREDLAEREPGLSWASLHRLPLVLLGAALPFSVILLAGAVRGLRDGLPQDTSTRFLVLWVALAVLPFLLVRPFERYLLPILPALVLLAERLLARVPVGRPSPGLLSAAALVALPVFGFAALGIWFESRWFASIPALVAVVAAIVLALRGRTLRCVQAMAVALGLTLGLTYPALGVNRITPELRAALAPLDLAHFASPYPGVLSMHLGRSLTVFDPDSPSARRTRAPAAVVLRSEDLPRLLAAARGLGLEPRERLRFRTFHARTQFLRFVREGVRWPDWRRALHARDWTALKPEFVVLDLVPAATPAPRPSRDPP